MQKFKFNKTEIDKFMETYPFKELQKDYRIKYSKKSEISDATIIITTKKSGEILLEYKDDVDSFKEQRAHLQVSFRNLRNQLLESGKILLCKGCRTDVHPSGGQLIWIYAYKLELNKRVNPKEDEVMIFDEELDMDMLGSVAEQDEFYEKWLDSIKRVPY